MLDLFKSSVLSFQEHGKDTSAVQNYQYVSAFLVCNSNYRFPDGFSPLYNEVILLCLDLGEVDAAIAIVADMETTGIKVSDQTLDKVLSARHGVESTSDESAAQEQTFWKIDTKASDPTEEIIPMDDMSHAILTVNQEQHGADILRVIMQYS